MINNVLQKLDGIREDAHTVEYDGKAGLLIGEFENSLQSKHKQGSKAENAAYPKLVT